MYCFNWNGIRYQQVKILVRLSELDFEISMLSLSILIGLPLDIISKCSNILSKPTEPKVSSDYHGRTCRKNLAEKLQNHLFIYILMIICHFILFSNQNNTFP